MTDDTNRVRLIILADMGNETDEEQQMAQLVFIEGGGTIPWRGLMASSAVWTGVSIHSRRPTIIHKQHSTRVPYANRYYPDRYGE